MTFENAMQTYQWLDSYFMTLPKALAARIEVMTAEDGTCLIRKGIHCPYLYILLSGNITIINEYTNGKRFSFASTSTPGFAGLLEYFGGQELPSATCLTSGTVTYARMRISDFTQWIENDFSAYKMFARYLARTMYTTSNRNGTSAALSKTHVLTEFIITNYSNEINTRGSCKIPLTREELALCLGISQRTVYRSIKELLDMNLISINKGKISLNSSQLGGLLEFLKMEEN